MALSQITNMAKTAPHMKTRLSNRIQQSGILWSSRKRKQQAQNEQSRPSESKILFPNAARKFILHSGVVQVFVTSRPYRRIPRRPL